MREKFSLPGTEPQLFDSLGSKVLTPFEEYYTPKDLPKDAVRYGYMKEDPDSVISWEFTRYQIYKEMGHFYYLIVNVNDMTEDYTVHKLHETSSGTEEKILTMEDIRMLLSYTGED